MTLAKRIIEPPAMDPGSRRYPVDAATGNPIYLNNDILRTSGSALLPLQGNTPPAVGQTVHLIQMSKIIKQLADLSSYSQEIFQDLDSETARIADRIQALRQKTGHLRSIAPSVEQKLSSMRLTDGLGERNDWKPFHPAQQLFSKDTADPSILKVYEACRPLPNLAALDQFREDKETCIKFYSYPQFFMERWRALMEKQPSKKNKKKKKKAEEAGAESESSAAATGPSAGVKSLDSAVVSSTAVLDQVFQGGDAPPDPAESFPSSASLSVPAAPVGMARSRPASGIGLPPPPPMQGFSALPPPPPPSFFNVSAQMDYADVEQEVVVPDLEFDIDNQLASMFQDFGFDTGEVVAQQAPPANAELQTFLEKPFEDANGSQWALSGEQTEMGEPQQPLSGGRLPSISAISGMPPPPPGSRNAPRFPSNLGGSSFSAEDDTSSPSSFAPPSFAPPPPMAPSFSAAPPPPNFAAPPSAPAAPKAPPAPPGAPPPPGAPAPPPAGPAVAASSSNSGISTNAIVNAASNLKSKPHTEKPPPKVDSRDNMLSTIKGGAFNLRKAQLQPQKAKVETKPAANDVASILMRRIALEASDSDNSDDDKEDGDDWD
eukprot:Partr_v1_DN28176_c0_g1_i1_m55956 putative WAS protein family, member